MEKKQTAVEFYRTEFGALVSMKESKFQTENEIFEQAKQMEKGQIADAWLNGMKGEMIAPLSIDNYKPEAEEYFNETYGGTQC